MKLVFQQGQADGLCGLYAILNFLERTKWKGWVDHNLGSLLYAAQHFGWLTPHHLSEGFEDYQLKAILDLQFANYRMPYQTFFLADVLTAHKTERFSRILELIVAKGGAAIIHMEAEGGGHWLLVTKEENIVVLDSDDQKRPRTLLSERRLKKSEWGVVILPFKRPKLQLDL